uniref:Uncharacterized protein n=1 Tax=Leersia perrieri TaxID=77586 RepID=A0A0D9WC60_9ORYZ
MSRLGSEFKLKIESELVWNMVFGSLEQNKVMKLVPPVYSQGTNSEMQQERAVEADKSHKDMSAY